MIYISITLESVEIIETAKGLFGKEEKITAVSRKVRQKDDSLVNLISEALKTAYPKAISQNQAKLVIPDDTLIIKRLPVSGESLTAEMVISRAKQYLTGDITSYENFYKDIKTVSGSEILYTALPLSTIRSNAGILDNLNIKLSFLGTTSFSVYALLKPFVSSGERLIYADFDHQLKLIVLDSEGPIEVISKKTTAKTNMHDLKSAVKKIKEGSPAVHKLILSGEKSLEISIEELGKELDVNVHKIGQVMDTLLPSQKINIDTGGVPSFYFDKVIGLLNLTKMTEVPNFAVDLKNIMQNSANPSPLTTTEVQESKDKEPEIPVETTPAKEDEILENREPEISPPVKMEVEEENRAVPQPAEKLQLDENVIEYRESGINSLAKNRLLLTAIFAAVALILFGGFLAIGQSNITLPFSAKPTLTPTVVPSPTITPTPTVDPSLKRSDLKLTIQNGTDKSGFARETSEKLGTLGYKNVTVGNADRDDYEKTVIRIKDTKKPYLSLLSGDLSTDFDTTTVESLPETDSADALVILGRK